MRKRLAVLGLITAAGGVAISRRSRRLAAVAPSLRSPALYLPISTRSDRGVRNIRRLMNATVSKAAPPKGVDVRTEHVPSTSNGPEVRVLVYERPHRPTPSGALIWMHGGGLIFGVPEQAHALCARMAIELDIVVINVDYRLAPEDPFPAGLEDCFAALAWAYENSERLGIDSTRIAVGGDSAGGGLAACLAQLAHDRDTPVCFQLLQYPMLDDRTVLRTDLDTLIWTNTSNKYAWTAYLGHPVAANEERPYAAASRRDDLSGLPDAWIGVGDLDPFHDESVDYANRLRAAGVSCDLHIVPGMYHAADNMVAKSPLMREYTERMTAALAAATMPPTDATRGGA